MFLLDTAVFSPTTTCYMANGYLPFPLFDVFSIDNLVWVVISILYLLLFLSQLVDSSKSELAAQFSL